MSLFTAREWWHTKLGADGDEFDQGSLCLANIDNDPTGKVKLVTGSLNGVLRVHCPGGRDYKVEDCLLETELESGILQLEAGRFLGGAGLCLAVLFPRKLAVFSLQAVGSSYLQLSKLYEHVLEHTAANMTVGGFGNITGTDYLCVQSYDGQLSFFEHEALAFSRFLPGFLIPGPLCYCQGSDSFVTCSAAFELESYKYSVLAAASGEKQPAIAGPGSAGAVQAAKRIQTDWKLVLGEAAVDIRLGRITNAGADSQAGTLIVLCEHTVFCVSLRGELLTQQRLEYHPACCWSYPCLKPAASPGGRQDDPPENLLIATHTKALLVYKGPTLVWAAKLDTQPVAVRVADIGANTGMIVTLDDAGALSVSYLGSEPPIHAAPHTDTRELNYEAMDAEHRTLLAKIKAADGHKNGPALLEPADKLVMKAQVPSRLDTPGRHQGFDSNDHDSSDFLPARSGAASGPRTLTVTLRLSHSGSGPLRGVGVAVLPPQPLTVQEGGSSFVVEEVPSSSGRSDHGSGEASVRVVFQVPEAARSVPASSTARFTAVYKTSAGEGRTAQLEVALPLSLFCQVVPPVKSAEFKVTLDTNRDPPLLTQIFSDLMLQADPGDLEALSRSQGANVLSLRYYGPSSQEVTILVSKNAGRYRLQANSFQSMALVASELFKRLAAYYTAAENKPNSSGKQPPFTMTFGEQLPLQDWFELVEAHFAARLAAADIAKQLEERAAQFRSVQKRLLTRFKDKTPAPLAQLDMLLEETYHQLVELGSSLEAAQARQATAAQALSAGTQLLLLLTRWRFSMSDAEYELLCSHLSPEVVDGGEAGWEEATEAAMTHLLRTCLAKSEREAAAAVPPLAAAQDTQRLRKHVALVLERLGKGMRLVADGSGAANGGSGESNGKV